MVRFEQRPPIVGRTTLLSAGVTAYKPHHHESREQSRLLLFGLARGHQAKSLAAPGGGGLPAAPKGPCASLLLARENLGARSAAPVVAHLLGHAAVPKGAFQLKPPAIGGTWSSPLVPPLATEPEGIGRAVRGLQAPFRGCRASPPAGGGLVLEPCQSPGHGAWPVSLVAFHRQTCVRCFGHHEPESKYWRRHCPLRESLVILVRPKPVFAGSAPL